jgi:carbon monoxide dehydrogenase subunit G
MAIRIEERFTVKAPASAVWNFLVDPRQVVTCLPGAELTAVVDDRTFDGNVRVRLGAITVVYRGRVQLVEVDEAARRVRMMGQGREAAGAGAARMSLESRVDEAAGGGAEVAVRADVDLVGRVVQLGRGFNESVAQQLFQEFARRVRDRLEVAAAPATGAGGGSPGAAVAAGPATPGAPGSGSALAAAARPEAVPLLPLLFRAIWAWVGRLLGLRRPR